VVRITVKVLLALLASWEFSREQDETTGFAVLVILFNGN
jgi:hypothetical protein